MKLVILVTTMHQTDLKLYTRMNIKSDAIIANQCERNELIETKINDNKVIMISTKTIGTSRNRNIAFSLVTKEYDYVLFSDDDLVYNEEYLSKIEEEFIKHPFADGIKFNLHDLSDTRKVPMKRIEKFEKATRKNMSASGVCGLVLKRDVLQKYNINFHENFGPGTGIFCGEDTIFIQELFQNKIKIYRSPIDIAGIDETDSTWFKGFNEDYFIAAGKVFAFSFPRLCRLLVIRSALKFNKKKISELSFFKILKSYNEGIKEFKKKNND